MFYQNVKLFIIFVNLNLFLFFFRHSLQQWRLPTRSTNRVRSLRGRLVGHGPARREARGPEEVAERVPEFGQLEESLSRIEDDEIL